MRQILLAIIVLAFFAGNSLAASDLVDLDSKIQILKEKVEVQIEKIKTLREQTSSDMSSACERLAAELAQSQEKLLLQIETLQGLKDQLTEKMSETDEAIRQLQSNIKKTLETSATEVESQIRDANSLIKELEAMKGRINAENDKDDLTKLPTITITPVSGGPYPVGPSTNVGVAPAPVAPAPPPNTASAPPPTMPIQPGG